MPLLRLQGGLTCWAAAPADPAASAPHSLALFLPSPARPSQVENIIDMPQNDGLSLLEASRICNQDIIRRVQQAGEGGPQAMARGAGQLAAAAH